MAEEKKAEEASSSGGAPEPEELHPQGQSNSSSSSSSSSEGGGSTPSSSTTVVTHAAKKRHAAYKPSHKGTFVGLAVVGVILVINAVGLWFVFQNQQESEKKASESVTLSAESLNQLGVSRNAVGSENVELTVNPDAKFGGEVTIAGDASIGGALNLNGDFNATSGNFADLQGGETAVESLNVNGDATVTDLNLRGNLTVVGTTELQGQVRISQLLTVNNNLNVSGSLSVGGSLGVKNLSVGDLTVSGHLIIKGPTPSVARGSLGSNGTVSISGNDAGGTVSVNIGAGGSGSSATLFSVTFNKQYNTTPHIVVTPVGRSVPGMYINRTTTGFSVVTPNSLGIGGFAFDYIAME